MPTIEELQAYLDSPPHYKLFDNRLELIIEHYDSYKRMYYEFIQKLQDYGFEQKSPYLYVKDGDHFAISNDLTVQYTYKCSGGRMPFEFLNLYFAEFMAQ